MFITKKHISRRTVLRGMGAIVALPFLEAMVPAMTPLRRTAASPKTRLACIEIVHGSAGSTRYGAEKNLWMPAKEGADFEFGMIAKPLAQFREYVTIVSQTECGQAESRQTSEIGADHFRSSAVFLTAAHPKQTMGSDIYGGPSIDQIYAQQFGQDTPVPSIQLSVEPAAESGTNCGFNYSCVYMDTISWSSPTTPLPMIYNPRAVFEELFGTGGSPEDRDARQKLNRSILDGITRDASRLQQNLGARDRGRFNDYLENVREIERRIQAIEAQNSSDVERELPSAPMGVPDSWREHVMLMADLQVAAFAGETTRVSTLKMSRDVSQRVFAESGNTTGFHSASHHGNTPLQIEEFAKVNRYHVSLVAYFLDKLKNTPDGDGNLLDHSLVLYGSAMGDSNVHNHKWVPMVLLGHAGGTLKGNLYVRCKDGTPQANILLTMLQKLGMEKEKFGDSTGPVAI